MIPTNSPSPRLQQYLSIARADVPRPTKWVKIISNPSGNYITKSNDDGYHKAYEEGRIVKHAGREPEGYYRIYGKTSIQTGKIIDGKRHLPKENRIPKYLKTPIPAIVISSGKNCKKLTIQNGQLKGDFTVLNNFLQKPRQALQAGQ